MKDMKSGSKNVLSRPTAKLLSKFSLLPWLAKFYLAGGTALALQYGHRQSIDLDWFCQNNIKTTDVINKLSQVGACDIIKEEANTVEGIVDGVKVSFFTYPYPLLQPPHIYMRQVRLADPLDIALMKLGAIAGRNTRKDFIDLYLFCIREQYDLARLMKLTKKKFPKVNYDPIHLYKSLVYFYEADKEPMPKMFVPVLWPEIKKFFIQEVRKSMSTTEVKT